MKLATSILFVFFLSFFLASSASTASADEAWKYCFSAEKVSCQSGNSQEVTSCLQREVKLTDRCNVKALKRAQRKLKKRVFAELKRLKESGVEISERVSTLEKLIKELREEEDLPNREEIIAIINDGILLRTEELEENLRNTFRVLELIVDNHEKRIRENEDNIKKLKKAFDERSIHLGFGGLGLLGTDGAYYGADATLYLPLGSGGSWTVAVGGFLGSASVFGEEGFGYGGHLAVTTSVDGDENWNLSIGPAILAGFNAGSGVVGFEAFTAGGGVEAQLSYDNWVKLTATPFVGAGGIKDISGGDIAFTGGALLRMEITPF